MSKVSQKSRLSPSITKGSNAINLGKNSGVDMGKKAQVSTTSGAIGVTQEVTNIAGVTVSAGANVDITPLDFGISVNPSEGTVSISTGAEIPGGLLGISGGIEIDANTGQIIGGSVGGEALGLGINVSNSSKGGLGVEFTAQIPGTPIELSLGFGFPPPKKTVIPPAPSNDTEADPENKGFGPNDQWPIFDPNCYYTMVVILLSSEQEHNDCLGYASGDGSFGYSFTTIKKTGGTSHVITGVKYNESRRSYEAVVKNKPILGSVFSRQKGWIYIVKGPLLKNQSLSPNGGDGVDVGESVVRTGSYEATTTGGMGGSDWGKTFKRLLDFYNNGRDDYVSYAFIPVASCPGKEATPIFNNNASPTPSSSSNTAPFPNPPPRKRRMDECCRESTKLLRLVVRHLGAERNTPKEDLPDGVSAIGSTKEGINQAYPFSVKKQWINPTAKEDEQIQVLNDRQLVFILGGMIERLEKTLGTAEFYKDSDKKLRQSEGNMLSWLTGKNKDFRYPDPNDFWLNTDDGIINEKLLEVRSVADGLRYLIEGLNRLERILPIAELKDSSIPARWIYPNGTGQLRVGNLIHLCEYLIRKQDKDAGYWPQKITIKAANPAIKDDEPITTDIHSQGDMLRVILQRLIDVEGDGDMGSNYDLRRTYLDIMAFQMTVKNNKYLQAITEYLSFDMTEEVSKVPIPFDPFAGQDRSVIEDWWNKLGFGQEKLDFPTKNTEEEIEKLSGKLLQNSELEVSTVNFGSPDERRDPKTLKEALIEILKHSSAASAAVTEVATEGALERIVDAAGLAQQLTSFLMRRDIRESLGIGDLDNWMSSAEKGYTDNLETESLRFPESDPSEPYGRPTTQNPVFREIDTKEDKAD
jgi:hypothetical protein